MTDRTTRGGGSLDCGANPFSSIGSRDAAARRVAMQNHFEAVAPVYREVRTTDDEPVRFIRDALEGRDQVEAADVGCGDGRYDVLLFRYLENLRLTCIDISAAMLKALSHHLRAQGISNFKTLTAGLDGLDLEAESFDCVFTFNAVHHFNFADFLTRAQRALRPKGRIFIYTRTPEQNAGSIWGRLFPEFSEREQRLYPLSMMVRWVNKAVGLDLLATKTFSYPRRASLERLLTQAQNRHYSTFSLYDADEFARACRVFEDNIRRQHSNLDAIEWSDENTLLEIARNSPINVMRQAR